VRSLRGSTSGSTGRPASPEDLTRLSPDQLPAGGGKGAEGLSTVVEEDLEDWVDDFDDISLEDVPLGVEGADRAAGSSQTQTQLTHESDSAFASQRPRSTSKTSRRSRKSSNRNTDLGELRLILDFPLPPTFIPTPNSKTPLSIPARLPQPQEETPVRDDESISEDRDPFRAENTEEVASVVNVQVTDADTTRVDSSASFYTAQSQSPSPPPSVQSAHTDPAPPPSPLPPTHPPPLSPLHLPLPDQPSLSPHPSRTAETPSSTHRSIRTLTKASATLKRFGNLTRETIRTSFRTPVSELSVRRSRRATTRVAHVSLDELQHSSIPNAERSPLLPDFQPEAFDVSFPAVETPHATPRRSRSSRAYPSVHSFYASLEEFLTSHLHSDDNNNNRRSRFISAPTLLLTAEHDTSKPATATSPPADTDTQVAAPPQLPPLPCPDRPLPPLPREGYDFVDPSTLTESATVSPASEYRYSSIPPSPSWLSRNVRDLEIALVKKAEAPSLSSSRSACGSDTDYATQTHTNSSSSISSPLRLRGEVVLLRGRVNIQDSKPRHITLRSSSRTPSEATVIQTRSRPRRNRSNHPRLPPSPSSRPRSRTSSVTKATITHYRRSLVESKKKSRSHNQKETPTKLSPRGEVPKACLYHSLSKCQR
jgi:hypothetical protein